MKTNLYLTSMLALAILAGCSNEDIESASSTEIATSGVVSVYASVDGRTVARLSDAAFDTDDEIGITQTPADGTAVENVQYIYDGSAFSAAGTALTYDGETAYSYTAYYPYTSDLTDGCFTYDLNDDTTDDIAFASLDATSEGSISLAFTHQMSKLTITISASEEFEAEPTTLSYSIAGVCTTGTFDTTTGDIAGTATGSVESEFTLGEASSIILPPTTGTALTLTVTVDDATYVGTFSPTLSAGYNHNFSVTLNNSTDGGSGTAASSLTISSQSVTGWTDGDDVDDLTVTAQNVLEVGDFLCADGTVIDKNAYSADADVVGIVYYVEGNSSNTISSMYPSIVIDGSYDSTNDFLYAASTEYKGLALSIEEVSIAFASTDSNEDYSLTMWYTKNDKAGYFPGRLTITTETGDDNTTTYTESSSAYSYRQKALLGYNNTQLWSDFITDKSLTDITALSELASFEAANAIDGTSGWFIPSLGDLYNIIVNDALAINTYLSNAGLDELSGTYWTSTYGRNNSGTIQEIVFKSTGTSETYSALTGSCKLRYAIAF